MPAYPNSRPARGHSDDQSHIHIPLKYPAATMAPKRRREGYNVNVKLVEFYKISPAKRTRSDSRLPKASSQNLPRIRTPPMNRSRRSCGDSSAVSAAAAKLRVSALNCLDRDPDPGLLYTEERHRDSGSRMLCISGRTSPTQPAASRVRLVATYAFGRTSHTNCNLFSFDIGTTRPPFRASFRCRSDHQIRRPNPAHRAFRAMDPSP